MYVFGYIQIFAIITNNNISISHKFPFWYLQLSLLLLSSNLYKNAVLQTKCHKCGSPLSSSTPKGSFMYTTKRPEAVSICLCGSTSFQLSLSPYFFILHSLILATAVIIFAGHNVGFGFPLSDFSFSLQHYQQRLISIFTLVYRFCLIIFIGELFHKHNILNTIGRPLRYRNRTVAAGSNSAVAV